MNDLSRAQQAYDDMEQDHDDEYDEFYDSDFCEPDDDALDQAAFERSP